MKERQRQAEESFHLAIEEGRSRNRSAGVLPLVGPDDTFNLNPMLLHNISVSPYFYQKCYGKIKDWNALVDEIYYEVKHLEPWTPGKLKFLLVPARVVSDFVLVLYIHVLQISKRMSHVLCVTSPLKSRLRLINEFFII